MNRKLRRQLALNQYHGYLDILSQRGIDFDALTDEEFENLPDSDIKSVVALAKDLARTPNR